MATTTPNYGWDVPTSTDYVKDGAVAIETLGDDIDATLYSALGGNYPGLRLIKKQTIGTGVSTVVVTDAFSATYDAYKIVISGGAGSTAGAFMGVRLGAANTNYAGVLDYANFAGSTVTPAGSAGSIFSFLGNADTNAINCNFEINNPFLSKHTYVQGQYIASANGGTFTGRQNSTTSFTEFTLVPSTGTLTGGTIYVYGYGAS
jgi:hypothetical protein